MEAETGGVGGSVPGLLRIPACVGVGLNSVDMGANLAAELSGGFFVLFLVESVVEISPMNPEIAMSDANIETKDNDGKADAVAALSLITIVIAAAVFWITNQ